MLFLLLDLLLASTGATASLVIRQAPATDPLLRTTLGSRLLILLTAKRQGLPQASTVDIVNPDILVSLDTLATHRFQAMDRPRRTVPDIQLPILRRVKRQDRLRVSTEATAAASLGTDSDLLGVGIPASSLLTGSLRGTSEAAVEMIVFFMTLNVCTGGAA